jgi:DNA-binding GntR family transcriptional regulator
VTALTGSGDNPPRTRAGDRTGIVHDSLRVAILRGEIQEGTWLSQVQLAKQFGVSRGPVREALRLLERESLIEAQINQRARVARFSLEDLEQLYATRIVTEALAISASIPRFTDDDLTEITRLLEQMEQVMGDIEAWEVVHRAFHLALVRYAGQPMLRTIEQRLDYSERYRRVRVTTRDHAWSVGAEEHGEIVEACLARDPPRAADRLARHLGRTALTVFMLAAPEHDPALVRAALRQTSEKHPPSTGRRTDSGSRPSGTAAPGADAWGYRSSLAARGRTKHEREG